MQSLKNQSQPQIEALARTLAKRFKNRAVAIGLKGELGAGKTTFAKAFAKAMGIKRIKSPTFIILSEYDHKPQKFYHLDLYRLTHEHELEVMGIPELVKASNRVLLIEWIDKFPLLQKQCDLVISLSLTGPKTRDVKITGI